MRMVRKQVYITEGQDVKIKRLAADQGVTEAEVLRRAIDGLSAVEHAAEEEQHHRLRETATMTYTTGGGMTWTRADAYRTYGRNLDDDAWREELAFIKERARLLPEGGSTKKWRREDAYDERRHGVSD